MKIHNRGMWLNNSLEGHIYDLTLNKAILSFLKNKNCASLIELGCGHGNYAKFIFDNGIFCEAFDGNPYTPQITNNFANIMDLSEKQDIKKQYDYVLCLEVGEHIPKEFEENFIFNIHNFNTKGVILSWANIGQGGDGHFNEKNNEDVIKIFENLSYSYNKFESQILRDESTLWWFKNTIMIFER